MSNKANIGNLIEIIGPINNQIRISEGYKKIELMWDVGNILVENGITKIHPIAFDIQKKSYITRDLISYCFRIRNKWPNKSDFKSLFSNVNSYTNFREALPFLENKEYLLDEKDIDNIISLLSLKDTKSARDKIIVLKKKYINLRNSRRQKIGEVKDAANIMTSFYNDIAKIIMDEDVTKMENIINNVGNERLLMLSQMCMSLTNDNYKGPKSINSEGFPDNFKLFVDNILPLSLSGKETKARLKRIFPPEKILEIADIMNSFRLGENISKIKNRIKMDINTR